MTVLAMGLGCATPKPRGADGEGLRAAAERFHRLVRWGDLRSAFQGLVPQQRLRAMKEALERKDDEALKVLDYDIVDARNDGDHAVVLSKISWHRLPSTVVRTDAVTLDFVARDGAWLIRAIEGGPLPLPAPAADEAPPAASR